MKFHNFYKMTPTILLRTENNDANICLVLSVLLSNLLQSVSVVLPSMQQVTPLHVVPLGRHIPFAHFGASCCRQAKRQKSTLYILNLLLQFIQLSSKHILSYLKKMTLAEEIILTPNRLRDSGADVDLQGTNRKRFYSKPK